MKVIQYPGYLGKEEAAKHYRVKVDTLRGWIRNKTAPDPHFAHRTIDGLLCIKDPGNTTPPPQSVQLHELQLAEKFARKNGMREWRVFEEIVKGNVTAVVLVGRVFVIKSEPALTDFVAQLKATRGKTKKPVGSFFQAASFFQQNKPD